MHFFVEAKYFMRLITESVNVEPCWTMMTWRISPWSLESSENNQDFTFFMLYILPYRTHIIAVENASSKGYHELQIRSPPLPRYYFRSRKSTETGTSLMHVLVWIPEIEQIPALYGTMHVTDEKSGEKLLTVTGLHVNRKSTNWTVLKNVSIYR